jgi:hypothetical protein
MNLSFRAFCRTTVTPCVVVFHQVGAGQSRDDLLPHRCDRNDADVDGVAARLLVLRHHVAEAGVLLASIANSGPPAGELMQLGYVSVDRDGKKDRLLSDPACRRRPPPPCDKRGLRHIPNQKRAAYP